jgi:hypothetical protein
MNDPAFNAMQMEAHLAFASALGAVELVTRSNVADTGKYQYRYADLGDVMDECKRACALFGLVLSQNPTVVEGHLAIQLRLIHKNGGTVDFDPLMMILPKEAQAYGSALTYARRYQLMTVFGIAPEDDDGKAATVAAQAQPGRRTEAERMIREQIAGLTARDRARYVEDFKTAFGVGLSDLPANKHGEALTWSREWAAPPDDMTDPTDPDTAGAETGAST